MTSRQYRPERQALGLSTLGATCPASASAADEIERACREKSDSNSLGAADIERLQESATAYARDLRNKAGSRLRALLVDIVTRLDLSAESIRLTLDLSAVDPVLATSETWIAPVPICSVRTGRQIRLVLPPAPVRGDSRKDAALIKLVTQALSLRERTAGLSANTFEELSKRLDYSREHAADLLRISYLAPDIIAAIVEGRQPAGLTRSRLIKTPRLPLSGQGQREALWIF